MAEENQTEEPAFGLLFEQSLNLDRGTGANMPTSTEEGVEREIMASEFNDISGAEDPIMAAAGAAEKRWAAKDAAKTDAAPEFKTFGEAFKHYRAKGVETFDWKGKQFTTALRSERAAQPKSAPKAAAKPTPKKAAAVAEKPAVAVVVATPAAPAPKAAAPAPAAPTEKPKRLLQFWGENVGETRSPYKESTQRLKDTFDPAKASQRIMERNNLAPKKYGPELM
ncbi:MAG: hypothetical protein ACMV1D_05030 [Macromonas sp.]